MIDFLKKPQVLLVLFALSSLFFGWSIADLITNGFEEGNELLIQIMDISGWTFLTIFFFYFYLKNRRNKEA